MICKRLCCIAIVTLAMIGIATAQQNLPGDEFRIMFST